MAVALDAAQAGAAAGAAATATCSLGAGTPSGVIACIHAVDTQSRTITSVTAGSQSMTFVGSEVVNTNRKVWFYHTTATPDTGTQTITVNFSAAVSHDCSIDAWSVTGGDSTTPAYNFASNTFASSVTPSQASTNTSTEGAICGCTGDGGVATIPDAGQTITANAVTMAAGVAFSSYQFGAANPTMGWTLAGAIATAIAVVGLKEASSGGGPVSGAASSAGSATGTGIGKSLASTVANSAGTAVATGVGASKASGVISSVGTSTATMVGAANQTAQGAMSSAGTSTGTAVGVSTVASVANAIGTSTGTMVGTVAAGSSGAMSSAGTSTGAMVGQSAASAVANAAGTSTGTFVGQIAVSGAMSAAGTSTGTMVGFANATAQGAMSSGGTSTGTMTGQSVASADMNAVGTSTATMVGTGGTAADIPEAPIVQQGASGGSSGWNPWSAAADEDRKHQEQYYAAVAQLMPQVIRAVIQRKLGVK